MACQEYNVGIPIDLERLKKELDNVLKATDFGDKAIIRNGIIKVIKNPDWKIVSLRSVEGKLGVEGSLIIPPHNSDGPVNYEYTSYMDLCPHVKEIVESLQPDPKQIYAIRFVKLASGGEIREHRDEIFLNPILDRIHIPVITHLDVIFNLDKKDYHLEGGKSYYTMVEKNHWLKNKSPIDRVHLIIDFTIPSEK